MKKSDLKTGMILVLRRKSGIFNYLVIKDICNEDIMVNINNIKNDDYFFLNEFDDDLNSGNEHIFIEKIYSFTSFLNNFREIVKIFGNKIKVN